ncbi:Aluminum-activated malate transporter [Sesbania bispinosa]|nr:Aluminum-activated malate transporter [Sesbania bispinosa]
MTMNIEPTTTMVQVNKAGLFGHWWDCIKALPGNSKSKIINVTRSIKKIGQDDPRRVIHSLKVGIALTLVSLLYYWRPLYNGFGVAGMWAVLTVVVVFEFTVGATLSKGLNRGFATLLAGALGIGGQHLATVFGQRGEPIALGVLVFILGTFFPKIKASLVTVSGYRVEQLLELAHQRLSTILIGGATCMAISLFVCPVWAGFEGEYFQSKQDIEKTEKSFLQGYKSVLNSKATEESLANLARWEPGHGRFRFHHPWKQYLKIGALARECAYNIEALNGYVNTEIQTSLLFKSEVKKSCTKMSSESSKALKAISSSIKTMTEPSAAKFHIENSKTAIEELKIALETVCLEDAELLAIVPVATVASILVEITKSVEKIYESVSVLSNLAHFKSSVEPINVSPEKPPLLHRGIIKPVVDNVEIVIHDMSTDSPEKEKCSLKM